MNTAISTSTEWISDAEILSAMSAADFKAFKTAVAALVRFGASRADAIVAVLGAIRQARFTH